jgi:hypothetical protein
VFLSINHVCQVRVKTPWPRGPDDIRIFLKDTRGRFQLWVDRNMLVYDLTDYVHQALKMSYLEGLRFIFENKELDSAYYLKKRLVNYGIGQEGP